jgi:hypothetical protein
MESVRNHIFFSMEGKNIPGQKNTGVGYQQAHFFHLHARQPAHSAITGKDNVKLIRLSGFKVVKDVCADKGGRNSRLLGQILGEFDGIVTDVDSDWVFGAQFGYQTQSVLTSVALEVADLEPDQRSEKDLFFFVQRRSFLAEELVLVELVAVVGDHSLMNGRTQDDDCPVRINRRFLGSKHQMSFRKRTRFHDSRFASWCLSVDMVFWVNADVGVNENEKEK